MHIDASKLENNSTIEGDICIIGAGAAGISMAMDWLGTKTRVILLEGGGFEYDEKVQELYAGRVTGQKYFPLKSSRLHYFGGTTGHWAGYCSTFDPIDFEQRAWVKDSGWPITLEDLHPYYERAHNYLELGPYQYDWKWWRKSDTEFSPLVDSDVVWNKMWQFSPPTRFGTKYRSAILKAKNIHLYTYANVTEITPTESLTSVESVTVQNHAGKTHTVRANFFVLACCSIQNARLLLASNTRIKNGLGNDHDQVGRYFMEHLEMKSAELWLTKPSSAKMYAIEFGVTKARAELAISAEAQRKHQILNGTSSLTPLEIGKRQKPTIEMWNDEDPRKSLDSLISGFSNKRVPKEILDKKQVNAFQLFTRIEQSPNAASRVTLDPERDSLGMPRAHLHWQLSDLDKKSIRKIYELIGTEFGRTNSGRVKLMEYLHNESDVSWPSLTGGGWHHMGTTRMSDDPKKGVVDKNFKVHSMKNLYVAGSSCFTTAGAANPTLTLVALTLRLSDHLKTIQNAG